MIRSFILLSGLAVVFFLNFFCEFSAAEITVREFRPGKSVIVDEGSPPEYIQFPLIVYGYDDWGKAMHAVVDADYKVTVISQGNIPYAAKKLYEEYSSAAPAEMLWAGGLYGPAKSWNMTAGFLSEFYWWGLNRNTPLYVTCGLPLDMDFKPEYKLKPGLTRERDLYPNHYLANAKPEMRVLTEMELRDFLLGRNPSEVVLSLRHSNKDFKERVGEYPHGHVPPLLDGRGRHFPYRQTGGLPAGVLFCGRRHRGRLSTGT